MRLARLDLTRYGKFTDFSIDFGKAEQGSADFHVIYGPNEAGKSTSFAAYLDLLFGIEQRTRYAFLHPYASMRVGGVLQLDHGAQEIIRIKRPQNSLLDGNAQPLDEDYVLGGLRAIDRDAYRTMFSLNDDSIEAGGESILASKGDLGQLLFSASAGLAHLSQALAQLRAEAEGFYRYRARSGELVELKARLAALKEQRERIDTLAIDYGRLVEAREAAALQYESTLRERAAVQSRIEEVGRFLQALPRLAELQMRRDAMAALEGLPRPPAHWAAELPALQKAEIERAARRDAVKNEIDTLEQEIAGISLDEIALAVSGEIETLADLRARHVTADKDLPERRLRHAELDREVASIAIGLGWRGEPKALILDTLKLARLRDLVERRSGIDAALASAVAERGKAERFHADVRKLVAEAGLDARPEWDMAAQMAALASALAAFRADDHAARRRLAARSSTTHREALAECLSALAPWRGDIEALAAMQAPQPGQVQAYAAELGEAARKIAESDKAITRLRAEQGRLEAELRALAGSSGVVTDEQAAMARAGREKAWARHRAALDAETADIFEALLRSDDLVSGIRLTRAGEAERLDQVTKSLSAANAALSEQEQLKSAAEAEHRAAIEKVAATIVAMSPSLPDMDPAQLGDWLRLRQEALVAGRQLRQAERELAEAEADGKVLSARLLRALDEANVPYPGDATPDVLAASAQAALDGSAERASLRKRLTESRTDIDERARVLGEAEAADLQWRAALAETCAGTWLATRIPDLNGLRSILAGLGALEPLLRERSNLADRIDKMDQDRAAFASELRRLAERLDMPGSATALDGYREICARVEQARTNAEMLSDRRKRLEDAKRRAADIEAQAAIDASHRQEMTSFFDVTTLEEVAERLRAVETRAGLLNQAHALERELLETVGGRALDEIEATLTGLDRASLDLDLAELKGRFADLDQRSRELFNAHSKAVERVEAVGGDDAVARIEQERRTLLTEIEEKARGYFRLRAGTLAAEAALQSYRDRHRSAMMERASEAFATISRGAYLGLAAQPEKDSEILIAKASDGTSKVASDLSRGTRFQLYLALRVAGYLEFAKARRPVPFVADDIMETFDDMRAEEAFRLFAEMAKVGQVIYLTHHQHLCDIAQKVCPAVRIHELPNGRMAS